MQKRKLHYIDLFAGAGGLSLGLYHAGLKGIFAIEKNADAFATLKTNLIDNKQHFDWPSWLPTENLDIEDVLKNYSEELASLNGNVDLIVGGPPCQGFSMAGQRNHKDIRNTMVHHYLKMIQLIMPTYVILENVHGFTLEFKADKSKVSYAQKVKTKLQRLGYDVVSKEIKMSDYGVPQNRVRFILVGSRKNNMSHFFELLEKRRDEVLSSKGLSCFNSVEDAIGDLLYENGTYPCSDCKQKFESGNYGMPITPYQHYCRHIEVNKPDSHRFAKHTPPILDLHSRMLATITPGKRITPSDKLLEGLKRRGVTLLQRNKQSPTVTSHPDDMVHFCEPRILTVREMARLQSFPDWYVFKGKYTTGGNLRKIEVPRYTQVGNAVPPLFAEQLGLVLEELENEV